MVTNTLALPQQLWGQVQGDIMQVRNLSNAASLLSGNAGSIGQAARRTPALSTRNRRRRSFMPPPPAPRRSE
jgi:conjugal transfer/entry exclusion protein